MKRAGVSGTGVRNDEADVQAVRAFDDGIEGTVLDQVDR